jgi:stage II sporulation protein D
LLSAVAFPQSTSVRVGLFANHPPEQIEVTGYAGLRILGDSASGAVTLRAHTGEVEARDAKGHSWRAPVVTLASRGTRWIDLKSPAAGRRTVGVLHVRALNGRLQISNVLPIETYVLGVVQGELGSLHFNPESLKAQIVASRSFVLASRPPAGQAGGRHAADGFDFCDGPHCQVFSGTREINGAFKTAMQETRGQFLSYQGRAIPGYFHDTCGGRTASVSDVWGAPRAPYLCGVADDFCRHARRAQWSFRASRGALRSCLAEAGWIQDAEALDGLRVATFDSSGRADQVCIQAHHSLWVPSAAFRQALLRHFKGEVLPSTLFQISRNGSEFIFAGKGWGHGVGLCQSGAIAMASAGKSYREILSHYYPGTQLDRLPELQLAAIAPD